MERQKWSNERNPVCSCLEKGVCSHILAVKKSLGENIFNTILGKLVLSRNNSQKGGRKIRNHASKSHNQPLIGSAAADEEETTSTTQIVYQRLSVVLGLLQVF